MKKIVMMVSLLSGALGLGTFIGSARADLPPPAGTKFVGYGFKVENGSAFKDYILLAYLCDTNKEQAIASVEAGAVTKVGRHGGNCAVFATKKSDYDAWQKDVHLSGDWNDPALEAWTKDAHVHRCGGGPTVAFTLPSADPRSEVVDSYKIQTLDDKTCTLVASAATTPTPSVNPPATANPTPTSSSAPSTATPPPTSRGCGGCAVANESGEAFGGLFALGLVSAILGRRRVDRSR